MFPYYPDPFFIFLKLRYGLHCNICLSPSLPMILNWHHFESKKYVVRKKVSRGAKRCKSCQLEKGLLGFHGLHKSTGFLAKTLSSCRKEPWMSWGLNIKFHIDKWPLALPRHCPCTKGWFTEVTVLTQGSFAQPSCSCLVTRKSVGTYTMLLVQVLQRSTSILRSWMARAWKLQASCISVTDLLQNSFSSLVTSQGTDLKALGWFSEAHPHHGGQCASYKVPRATPHFASC